jgi:hypothetical protein
MASGIMMQRGRRPAGSPDGEPDMARRSRNAYGSSLPDSGPNAFEAEYRAIHDQRLALIRAYNLWYACGHLFALAYYWFLLNLSLSLSSRPMLVAAGVSASAIVWFAYRVVLGIDRGVVALYPRIVFLELALGYDFYRDYLRRRPRGDTERSFIERCEQIAAGSQDDLWNQVYSNFNDQDFPGDRRITAQFKSAAYLSVALFWIIIAIILLPQYLPWR